MHSWTFLDEIFFAAMHIFGSVEPWNGIYIQCFSMRYLKKSELLTYALVDFFGQNSISNNF